MLHTPDAIAPAVLPYLACLYGERGMPMIVGSNGRHIAYDKKDANCVAERRRAKADALNLLHNQPLPAGQTPDTYVEGALSDMDAFVAGLPLRKNAAGEQTTIDIPLTIEDEMRPAYERYEDCLRTQVSFSQATVDTVMAVFGQAMAVCRSVRDYAVTQAADALVKKGWDPATRAKAAENTFATADRLWLETGRQFRDSAIARIRGQNREH